MQESEMRVIHQKQSFWWKIGGWLPVVIMSGIFFSLTYVLQSMPTTPSPDFNGTGDVSDGVLWTDWVPLGITMFLVVIGITVAFLKREAIKSFVGWGAKEPESKKWFWYIIVLIITITLSSVSPDEHRYAVAMITALLGLHVVWLVLLKDQTVSTTTKVIVTGFFLYYIAAGLLPGTSDYFGSKWRIFKKDVAVKSAKEKDYADKYEKGVTQPAQSAHQSPPVDNSTGPYVYSQTLQVVPGERFKRVSIPPGRIIKDITWDCPDGCILEIVHDGQPLCPTTNIYQGLPCGSLQPDVGNGGTTRNREQFAMPYGRFINFPRDIVLIGVSFGTDKNLGPIEVTTTVTI